MSLHVCDFTVRFTMYDNGDNGTDNQFFSHSSYEFVIVISSSPELCYCHRYNESNLFHQWVTKRALQPA